MLYGESVQISDSRGKVTTAEQKAGPCPRCKGRMLTDTATGDQTCFSCGNVIYNVPAWPIEPGSVERRPSHGGQSLG